MTLPSFIIFLPAIFLGALIIHSLWPEKSPAALFLKFSLGVGLGLGISSILYFLILHIAPGRINMLSVQMALLVPLLVIAFLRARNQKKQGTIGLKLSAFSRLQWGLIIVILLALAMSMQLFFNYMITRPQGEYDAWSIWNRAARFIYRDPENWQATLSPDISVWGHADYPLLVPLNVAWGWEILNNETLRVPMAQSVLFTFSIILMTFSVLALTQTIGQACLATVVLLASSRVVLTGTNLTGDIPVTYFIFASSILMYLFWVCGNPALLALSGFMAGLAGWSKNEGLLFIVISPLALMVASPKNARRVLPYFLTGLAVPLMVILYFKTITPSNDLINSNNTLIEKITDLSRYWLILKSLALIFFSNSTIALLGYTAVMFDRLTLKRKEEILVISSLLLFQLLGYCAIYVITPNDLSWHLATSLDRLILQIFPIMLFLCFNITVKPEAVFS